MKVQTKVSHDTIIEAEGDTLFELFSQLASLQEVFGQKKCEKCQETSFKYQVREQPDKTGKKIFQYPELVCNNPKCRAKLAYGQSDNGEIYPKRYKMDGKEYILDQNGKKVVKGKWGWAIYNSETGEEE